MVSIEHYSQVGGQEIGSGIDAKRRIMCDASDLMPGTELGYKVSRISGSKTRMYIEQKYFRRYACDRVSVMLEQGELHHLFYSFLSSYVRGTIGVSMQHDGIKMPNLNDGFVHKSRHPLWGIADH